MDYPEMTSKEIYHRMIQSPDLCRAFLKELVSQKRIVLTHPLERIEDSSVVDIFKEVWATAQVGSTETSVLDVKLKPMGDML